MGGRQDGGKKRSLSRGLSFKRTYKIEGHNVSKCVKYSLFIFNLIFWLCGGILLGVGIYASVLQNSWQSLAGWSTSPAILLIVVGAIMFVIGFSGCIGALRENICLLKMFSIALSIILVLEIAGGVAAFLLQDKVTALTEEKMTEAITMYHSTNMQTDLDDATEAVQIRFKCCGAKSPRDWLRLNRYFNCTKETFTQLLTGCGVPPACCKNESSTNTQCGYKVFGYPNITAEEKAMWPRTLNFDLYVWENGCADAVIQWVKDNYLLLGGIALGILIVQILGIVLSVYMVDQIKYILKFNV